MAFKPVTEFTNPEEKRVVPIPFVSFNKYVGGYLGGGLSELLGNPEYLEIEFDPDSQVLRLRATDTPGTAVKQRTFKLPRQVRETMVDFVTHFKVGARFNIQPDEDGWWVTTTRIPEAKR